MPSNGPQATEGAVRAWAGDRLGVILGGTEHLLSLDEARALVAALSSKVFEMSETMALRSENMRLRGDLEKIANGATGYIDRDSTLADWAREALRDD